MTENDRKEFFVRIGDVYAFYRKDFSAFAGAVWWEAMKPFDLDAIVDALNRHCINPDNGQFLPMPADVVRMLQGSTQDSALVAWSKVDRAVRTIGTYESVVFDDALIHRVVSEMGGWVALGSRTEDEWPFQRNEFVNRYRGYRIRGDTPPYPRVLTGIINAHNDSEGFRSNPPTLIGNKLRARQVMQGGTNAQLIEMRRAHSLTTDSTTRWTEAA